MVERRSYPFIAGTSAYDYGHDLHFDDVMEFRDIRKRAFVSPYTLKDGLRDSRNLSRNTSAGRSTTLILIGTTIAALVLLSFTLGLIVLL